MWDELESKKAFQGQSVTKYLRRTLVFSLIAVFETFLLVLAKFWFWRGGLTLGYNCMRFRHFSNIYIYFFLSGFSFAGIRGWRGGRGTGGRQGNGGGDLFSSSMRLPPASRALGHWPGDCCGGLASAHGWQSGSGREPLVSGRESLATGLRALIS